jgi:hypothetical protein
MTMQKCTNEHADLTLLHLEVAGFGLAARGEVQFNSAARNGELQRMGKNT